MAPLHLLMVTMTSGRRKEIITTEGVGEEGHVDEEGEGVVDTMEAGGVVATVMIMAMAGEAGTMKKKNTMMSPKNMLLPLAVVSPRLMTSHVDVDFALHSQLHMACGLLVSQGVAGEEEGCLGVGVVGEGHCAEAEEATTRQEMQRAKWVC